MSSCHTVSLSVEFVLFVTAVGRGAVKSECDATVSVPTDKPIYSGSDSSAALSMSSQQNAAGAPPVKRPR